MSHTPTPWVTTRKFEIGTRSQEDDQSNGMVIPFADVFGDNRSADAAFIVRAANAYEVMVEALEHAREKMWEYGFSENDLQPIRDALAFPFREPQ